MIQTYLQAIAAVLLTVILGLVLGKTSRETVVLLTVLICCMLGGLMVRFLEPVMELLRRLRETAGLDAELLGILLKAVGIGFLGEIACLVCNDAGNGAMGKGLQMLSVGLILCLSIPLLEQLLDLITAILGEV